MNISSSLAIQNLQPPPGTKGVKRQAATSPPQFSGKGGDETLLKQALKSPNLKNISGLPNLNTIEQAINKGQPIPLDGGKSGTRQILYGVIKPGANGKPEIKTNFDIANQLISPGLSSIQNLPAEGQAFFVLADKGEKTNAALKQIVSDVIPAHLQTTITTTDKKGVKTEEKGQVIYSDLLEKLCNGQNHLLSDRLRNDIELAMKGESVTPLGQNKTLDFSDMGNFYKVLTPGNASLQAKLNAKGDAFRSKLLGLELARKIYSEGQEVEWQSVAFSLALGGVGEPGINALFHEGGTTATIARTALMSGIDITGNVLSVMGMIKEKHKSLSTETIWGPKGQRKFFNPAGKAGPDVKDGVKHGLVYGLTIGAPFNAPAGAVLSIPNADVLSRSVIGGLSGIGSAVAIPPAVKKDLNTFTESIKKLEKKGAIKKPDNVKTDAETDKWARQMALKEMNTRLGYASSIKATHPLPLIGAGAAILGAEKLGIPREYVQTAFMGLAPVMNNALRLVFAGAEKLFTIPQRMKTLESVVMNDDPKKAKENEKKLNDALYGSGTFGSWSSWYTDKLTNTTLIAGIAAVLFAAEVAYFFQTKKKHDNDADKAQAHQPHLNLKPSHYPMEFGDKTLASQPSAWANPFNSQAINQAAAMPQQPAWPSQPIAWQNPGLTALPPRNYNALNYNPQRFNQPQAAFSKPLQPWQSPFAAYPAANLVAAQH